MSHALVTGGAGFIGSHLVDLLLDEGWRVTVVDNFDPFYEASIKRANLDGSVGRKGFRLVETDVRDLGELRRTAAGDYDVIIHLAAKAGVRPSIQDPLAFHEVNVGGTHNVLELARELGVRQFVFASSSSVYGMNPRVPWREDDPILMPVSPYARTKVRGELMGQAFSHLHGMRFVALRFFTVYGPRQRPDLAIFKFARLMLEGKPVPFFGDGTTRRDYTYVDDILSGVRAAMDFNGSMYEIINLGNCRTVSLSEMVSTLEEVLGVAAILDRQPEQPGDVPQTYADISKAAALLGYVPRTEFLQGIRQFAAWQTALV